MKPLRGFLKGASLNTTTGRIYAVLASEDLLSEDITRYPLDYNRPLTTSVVKSITVEGGQLSITTNNSKYIIADGCIAILN